MTRLKDGIYKLADNGRFRGRLTVTDGIVTQADEGLEHLIGMEATQAMALDNAKLMPSSTPRKRRTEIEQ